MEYAEKTILLAALNFPLISKNVWGVMDHKLFTIGNGYEWINGLLLGDWMLDRSIDIKALSNDPLEWPQWSVKRALKRAQDRSPDWELLHDISEKIIADTQQIYETIRNNPQQYLTNIEANKIYPFSEQYSCIFTMPDDADPSWIQMTHRIGTLALDLMQKTEEPFIGGKNSIEGYVKQRIDALQKRIDHIRTLL
jgi:hypothetical protein